MTAADQNLSLRPSVRLFSCHIAPLPERAEWGQAREGEVATVFALSVKGSREEGREGGREVIRLLSFRLHRDGRPRSTHCGVALRMLLNFGAQYHPSSPLLSSLSLSKRNRCVVCLFLSRSLALLIDIGLRAAGTPTVSPVFPKDFPLLSSFLQRRCFGSIDHR